MIAPDASPPQLAGSGSLRRTQRLRNVSTRPTCHSSTTLSASWPRRQAGSVNDESRGFAMALAGAPLVDKLAAPSNKVPPVWPSAHGDTRGL